MIYLYQKICPTSKDNVSDQVQFSVSNIQRYATNTHLQKIESKPT